jgi:hypothetical protein
MYHPTEQLELAVSVHNILDTRIELPEIARDDDAVPTIPKTDAATVFGTVTYNF